MKPEDAEEYTQALGQVVAGGWRQIALGQRLGVPKALGLSVDAWVKQRLGGYVKLSLAERLQAAEELKAQGHTEREIADVIGVSQATVHRALDSNESVTPPEPTVNGHSGDSNESEPLDVVAGLAATEKVREAATADGIREGKRAETLAELESIEAQEAKAVEGVFDVAVIDPPWPMKKIERDKRPNQAEFDYPRMDEQQLRAVQLPLADDAHVWLWTTHSFLSMAFRLLDAWELKYVCTFVWHKPGGFQPVGLPQYNCEFALYARKGTPIFKETKQFPTCFDAPRGTHSEKPDAFYELVRRVTSGRRIDMFNRREIEGFVGWGKEAA